ncbi:MAG: DUF86 domain-containing protein [Bacteroidetes bacterium]|nr:DUF86 domain-containing protein [Bacteroidota bacterium]MBU1484602.1 DUF86 domain-containing protein [Bacteroidota bacterium]MBU1759417.1 DUF86 domain-containing protein [Bacteroidota bacterium]MBU2269060.1 DUF86 domain-containing protein [Bacteroidota bacterium]MBU2375996.1 DUF86 domain-containing protein [Bacteroidota bacterium]
MSERETKLLLEDILDSLTKIELYTLGFSFEDYESDSKTKDAVERNFEKIGEASSRISDDYKLLNPAIEWRILKDFRNLIIHEYFGINNQIIWDTIKNRLPNLKQDILKLITTDKL